MRAVWLSSVIVAAVLLTPLACAKKEDKSSQGDEIARANYLVEQGQNSEAIYILTERLKREPKDHRAHLILASAYAARAGITLAKYESFAAEILKWDKADEFWPDGSDTDLLSQIAKAAWRIQLVIHAFDAIPKPATPEAIADVTAGLQTLDDSGDISGGPAIYRALLRTVIFKVHLTDKSALNPDTTQGCQVDAKAILQWMGTIESDVHSILTDIGAGISDAGARDRLQDIATKLHSGVEDAENTLAESSGVAQALMVQVPPALRKAAGVCL